MIDRLADAAMIGFEDRLPPHLGIAAPKCVVAGDDGCFADARDRARRAGRTVAVDHQPRIALRDQMRIELFGERVRYAGNADIPGDVPRQLAFRQTEMPEDA